MKKGRYAQEQIAFALQQAEHGTSVTVNRLKRKVSSGLIKMEKSKSATIRNFGGLGKVFRAFGDILHNRSAAPNEPD